MGRSEAGLECRVRQGGDRLSVNSEMLHFCCGVPVHSEHVRI